MPKLKDYLITNGVIYTVRKFNMPSKDVWIDKTGWYKRTHIKQIFSKKELEPYADTSGFDSLDEWWDMIKYLIPTHGPYFLYKVEARNGRS